MKMKKGLLTMLALLSMGSSAFAQGTLDVPEVARKAGNVKQVVVLESEKKGTVKIRLAGTENYRDLQFDIKLPAGVTAADGKVVINTDHAVESAALASDAQTVRFVLYSTTGQNLSNDILLEIPVKVADDVDVANVDGTTATFSKVLSSISNEETTLS
jgi:ABC-type glycerol-3-phosphate transport system substrate-binding protein